MIARIMTATAIGITSFPIEVEVDLKAGLPSMQIVGMGNKSIDEARERVRSAIRNSGLDFPAKKITVNLAPAELPKDGTAFDLPIAIGVLVASGLLKPYEVAGAFFCGELALDGSVRPIREALTVTEAATTAKAPALYIPSSNQAQALLLPTVPIIPVPSLRDLFLHLKKIRPIAPALPLSPFTHQQPPITSPLEGIAGQVQAKRALTIAVAGRHNILLSGPPGSGKTMLARAVRDLLPPLSATEQIEVTKLYGAAHLTNGNIIRTRPFRSPHHSTSVTALIGGGIKPRPGEASLAHRGVLFLDEFLEFSRASLEALRQPLEERHVTLARLRGSVDYPADCMLVAATNPCPCGYLGDETQSCTCTSAQISAYQKKLSGPLLDRIDMHVPLRRVPPEQIFESKLLKNNQQLEVMQLVLTATNHQRRRYNSSNIYNGNSPQQLVAPLYAIHPTATTFLNKAAQSLQLTARSYIKVLRVARTIADLESSDSVTISHVSEALQYRLPLHAPV